MDDTTEFEWRGQDTQDGQSELSTLRGELLRIDGKAAALLTLAGAGFALATAVGPRGRLADWLLAAGLVAFAVAILQLLVVVRPRLEPGWPRGAEPRPVERAPIEHRRRELAVLSAIVLAKYHLLRMAASLVMCALILVLASELALLL